MDFLPRMQCIFLSHSNISQVYSIHLYLAVHRLVRTRRFTFSTEAYSGKTQRLSDGFRFWGLSFFSSKERFLQSKNDSLPGFLPLFLLYRFF